MPESYGRVVVTLHELLEEVREATNRRSNVDPDVSSARLEELDTDLCLLVRRTFTRLIDLVGLVETVDPGIVETIRTTFQGAADSLVSTYDEADRFSASVNDKLALLGDIERGTPVGKMLDQFMVA